MKKSPQNLLFKKNHFQDQINLKGLFKIKKIKVHYKLKSSVNFKKNLFQINTHILKKN